MNNILPQQHSLLHEVVVFPRLEGAAASLLLGLVGPFRSNQSVINFKKCDAHT